MIADAARRLVVLGLLAVVQACGSAPPSRSEERRVSIERVPREILEAYARKRAAVRPSLVSLRTPVGMKSGALIDRSGLVLTCLHGSVPGFSEEVTFADGRVGKAKVRATAPDLDIALLEITSPQGPFRALPFAQAAGAGDWIFLARPASADGDDAAGRPAMMGNPLAYGEDIYVHSALLVTLPAFPGDSGAPLLNVKGEIVGVALGSAHRQGAGTLCGASAAGIQDALPFLREGRSLSPITGAQQVETFLRALSRPVPALEESGNAAFVAEYLAKLADLDRKFRGEWKGKPRLSAEPAQEALSLHYREISKLLEKHGLLK